MRVKDCPQRTMPYCCLSLRIAPALYETIQMLQMNWQEEVKEEDGVVDFKGTTTRALKDGWPVAILVSFEPITCLY